ncbi:MAG: LLM class flavin-dependent oxidoreductase [Thermomicrobiales bacterium]
MDGERGTDRRPVKVGLVLPDHEGLYGGAMPRWRDIRELAELAEEVGFDSLWVCDHLINHWPDGSNRGTWECMSDLAALAAVTDRVELGTLVICTAFRNPALLAKMTDTIEEISGGRLILGIGAGWNEKEFATFGYSFANRVSRFEEALAIITGLLRDGHIDFQGKYYAARDCELRPRGPRPGGPPILIGSNAPRMLDLLARHGHAWNTWYSRIGNRAEGLPPLQELVDAACVAAGRNPAEIMRTATVYVVVGPSGYAEPDVDPISGSPEEIAAALRAFADVGVTHLQVRLEPNTPAGIAAFAPVLDALDGG